MKYYVSKTGNNDNSGKTWAKSFLTIQKGIDNLSMPGDILTIGGGAYVEKIRISQKNGTEENPVIIRSKNGEVVNIDGTMNEFRNGNFLGLPKKWERLLDIEPGNTDAHPDEYVSIPEIPLVEGANDGVKGAFLNMTGMNYTRLITYSNIKDLRSVNEKFGQIRNPDDTTGLAEVVSSTGAPLGYYFPFVYMGPGIWLNRVTRKLHIRLSHTHNQVTGLTDYTGQTNPNKLPLAISLKSQYTFWITGSSHVHIRDLSIRFGGETGVKIEGVDFVRFDRIQFRCSEYGLNIASTHKLTIQNCVIDGGLPTWYFRSDRKSEYDYLEGGVVTHNKLSSNTISSLISGNPLNTEMEIHHCEFQNGHDLYLRGDVWFHHNLINNFNDDAVFLQKQTGSNVKIHHNVFTRCLTCFSHAGNVLTALSFIYRNLIDLRLPTAGYRPLHPLATTESGEDRSEWRYGWLYKSDGNIGGVSYFHNTILAYTDKSHHSSFTHLLGSGNTVPRHSINNIFVAINHDELIRKSIMRFSSPEYPDITDGNLYYRIGLNNYPPFDYLGFSWQGITETEKRFDTLEAFRSSQLFILSKEHYLPGYESNSVFASPQFRRMQFDGILPFPLLPDDLRLRANSPARRKGILLPQPLRGYDQASDELLHPDIGCYVFNGPALKVGIDGSKSFP